MSWKNSATEDELLFAEQAKALALAERRRRQSPSIKEGPVARDPLDEVVAEVLRQIEEAAKRGQRCCQVFVDMGPEFVPRPVELARRVLEGSGYRFEGPFDPNLCAKRRWENFVAW